MEWLNGRIKGAQGRVYQISIDKLADSTTGSESIYRVTQTDTNRGNIPVGSGTWLECIDRVSTYEAAIVEQTASETDAQRAVKELASSAFHRTLG